MANDRGRPPERPLADREDGGYHSLMKKTIARADQSVQRKAQSECKKLRAILRESVSIYNKMADLLDTARLKIREIPRSKVRRRN